MPHISMSKEFEPASYQVFELVSATYMSEGKPARKPTNSKDHLNMDKQLKTRGYEPRKGLGRLN